MPHKQSYEMNESGPKLSKVHSALSTKSYQSQNSAKESMQNLKSNPRSKSYTTQGLTSKLSQEERKEKEKLGLSGISENYGDKSHDRSGEDDTTKNSKRFHGKLKSTSSKLQREKSYNSKNDSVSEVHKKDSSVSEEKSYNNIVPFDSTTCIMDYYEEQKSNDADELLRDLNSYEDEKDEVYQVNMDELNEELDSDDDLEIPMMNDERDDGSQEETITLDNSGINETVLGFGESFDKSQPSGLGNDLILKNKEKSNISKKKEPTQQKEDNKKKKKAPTTKGQQSGKQNNRFSKSKKNKYMANRDMGSGNKGRGSVGSDDED